MALDLVHTHGKAIRLEFADKPLCTYTYHKNEDPFECLRPYFHPVHSLAGDLVTIRSPYDHRWHKGIGMVIAVLTDGQTKANFWGGNSYVHGEGYKAIDNIGRMHHKGWTEIAVKDLEASFAHMLEWETSANEIWLQEQRRLTITVRPDKDYWQLGWQLQLKNTAGKALKIGSPTTEGRPNAGYGGLFWRGPREFSKSATIYSAAGVEGEAMMGERAEWLAFVGQHDDSLNHSSLIFQDHPDNPRYPTKWFVRQSEFAVASFAFMFDEYYELAPGEELELNYTITVANGNWSADDIAKFCKLPRLLVDKA